MQRIERALQGHFAMLTALGGLLLSAGDVGLFLPAIAVLSAFVSYIVVDRNQWFSVKPALAYVGMGIVAIYCMAEFLIVQNNTQLNTVAKLLVMVLVVLSFQKKSLRVFEQIGVFCLLELIVAAVFNSALIFGFTLIPFSIVGLRALVLLQALSAVSPSDSQDDLVAKTSAEENAATVAIRFRKLPRYGITVLTPSVLLVAVFFFYGLPRTQGGGDGSRVGGQVTTGFSESMTLDQVGELLGNRDLVMRVRLTDQITNQPYKSRDPIYFRGQSLEEYRYRNGVGTWRAVRETSTTLSGDFIPSQYERDLNKPRILFDDIKVSIDLQPVTKSNTLFAIAPYYGLSPMRDVTHRSDSWTLRRSNDKSSNGRFAYEIGTHAFANKVQTKFIRFFPEQPSIFDRRRPSRLRRLLVRYDDTLTPSVTAEAEAVAKQIGSRAESPYQLAAAIEKHLAESGKFQYTTELTEQRNRRVDPLDEFISKHRRGHCQYFASAMVMMLRSQGVPARVVVGYRSGEYNSVGNHYLVRQLHAHAWVEVLLDEDEVPLTSGLSGQYDSGPVLVRFDPTPARDELEQAGRVEHFYDFAQSLWNNYVLDMDGERQAETLFGNVESSGVSSAYSKLILQIQVLAAKLNQSQLGAGAPRRRTTFLLESRGPWHHYDVHSFRFVPTQRSGLDRNSIAEKKKQGETCAAF